METGGPENASPTFTKVDEDGNETEGKVDAPEGSKFAIPEDFKVPEGYVVEIDEATGEITVTYPDGTRGNVDITVTVDNPDKPVDEGADTTPPKINPIKPDDKDGNWTVDVPNDVNLETGDEIKVEDGRPPRRLVSTPPSASPPPSGSVCR